MIAIRTDCMYHLIYTGCWDCILCCFTRFSQGPQSMATTSRVKGDESAKSYRRLPISSGNVIITSQDDEHAAITEDMNNTDTESSAKTKNIVKRSTISDIIDKDEMRSDGDVCRTTSEVTDGKQDACGQNLNLSGSEEDQKSVTKDHTAEIMVSEGEEVSDNEGHAVSDILAESRHRDGSMYRGMDLWWKKEFCVADCNESQLEAMRLSYPSDCIIDNGTCLKHFPSGMLQIFSLKVAKIPADYGVVELYGYVAVRDDLDQLLNYVVNICRDDPITVEQGSLIKMDGPKRGIYMMDFTLVEYDMRIKTSEQEEDDLQLIDGASLIGPIGTWNQSFRIHIPSDCGAVDITLSRLVNAVEATVEVLISGVQRSFNLCLGCLTSGSNEEIWLFDGTVAESCGLKRSVVAVLMDSVIDLKFKVDAMSSGSDQHSCSFMAKTHGHDTQEIKTDFALISVKLTWSALS